MAFVTVRIPDDLKDRIDVARPATVSREAWVRDACRAALAMGGYQTDLMEGRVMPPASALEAGQTAAASVGQQVEPGVPLPPAPTASVVPSVLPRTHEPSECPSCFKYNGPPQNGNACGKCGARRTVA